MRHDTAFARHVRTFSSALLLIALALLGCDDDESAGQSQLDASDTATASDQTGTDTTSDVLQEDVPSDVADTDVADLDDTTTPPDLDDGVDPSEDTTTDTVDDADPADTTVMDAVDPEAPTCTIVQPADASAQPFDQTWDFVASAVDPQDGVLSGASVVWTTNRTSTPIGTGTQFTTGLEGSGDFVVTCTAYDADGNSGSGSITITLESPLADIFHPSNAETRQVSNGPFPFVGQAEDAEDGMLSGASLVWTTTINGSTMQIGTGTMFNALLPEGTNEVTLTATDANGNSGSETIIVIMVP